MQVKELHQNLQTTRQNQMNQLKDFKYDLKLERLDSMIEREYSKKLLIDKNKEINELARQIKI